MENIIYMIIKLLDLSVMISEGIEEAKSDYNFLRYKLEIFTMERRNPTEAEWEEITKVTNALNMKLRNEIKNG